MPSAIDLIGHNPALQEHWIRRFFAALIDAIVVAVIYLLFALPLGFASLAWFVVPFPYGIVWLLYSMLLETLFGATIGKRLLSLRVVALDGNLDIIHCLVRNISKVYWLLFLVDLIIGGVTEGDPRQRLLDRIARTTVTPVDQGAYMEEQFRMMQHAGPYPMTMPQAPPRTNPPPAPGSAQAAPAAHGSGWPGAAPAPRAWPQHGWGGRGRPVKATTSCAACGGQRVGGGDGERTC